MAYLRPQRHARGQHPCTRFMAIGHLDLVSHFLLSDCEGIARCCHCCRARQPGGNLLAHSGRAHRPMHQVLRGCFLSGPFQSALGLRASVDARYGDNLHAHARIACSRTKRICTSYPWKWWIPGLFVNRNSELHPSIPSTKLLNSLTSWQTWHTPRLTEPAGGSMIQ